MASCSPRLEKEAVDKYFTLSLHSAGTQVLCLATDPFDLDSVIPDEQKIKDGN